MTKYWFKPKAFGYGATPTTWEGWLFTLISALVAAGAIIAIVIAETNRWPGRRPLEVACAFVFVATLIGTIIISRNKTDGDWRWRS